MEKQDRERQEAAEYLRSMLRPGDTVYTILKHCSSSGMSREISLRVMIDNEPRCIDWHVAKLLNDRIGKHDGIVVRGCGMDMGFHLVYGLSRTLFADGHECIGEGEGGQRCPSNDHSNGDRNYEPHMHRDGGYALRHRWL